MENYEYVWIRCRTRHSSGPGSWEYREVARSLTYEPHQDDEKFLREQAREYSDENNTYSEHFRGADAEFAVPDKKWVRAERKRVMNQISDLRAYAARLRKVKTEEGRNEGI